jgi:hypothetical protein
MQQAAACTDNAVAQISPSMELVKAPTYIHISLQKFNTEAAV